MLPLDVAYGPSFGVGPVAIVVALIAVVMVVVILWLLLRGGHS